MSEDFLLAEAVDIAVPNGVLAFHSTDSRRDIGRGFGDLVLVGGNVLFVELKSATGKLSSEQISWKYRLMATGAHYAVWIPGNLESGHIEAVMEIL